MCTAITIVFYSLIFLSLLAGAASWGSLQKYAAAVAKSCGLEKELFDAKAGDDSGASAFEVKMFKEIMSKKYLARSEDLIELGVKARSMMLIAIGSGAITVVTAGIRHVTCAG